MPAVSFFIRPLMRALLGEKKVADPALVKEIEITVNPYVLELTGKPEPQTGLEGKFSIYHTGAIAFLDAMPVKNSIRMPKCWIADDRIQK